MWGKTAKILTVVCLAGLAGCIFGAAKPHGVIGYRHDGRVFLSRNSFYRVGRLPDGWKRMSTKARAISFYNPQYKASISTDAFCGREVSDRRLDVLSGEVISALENRRLKSETPFELNGRGALRQVTAGDMDGVPVIVDFVVVRKDNCVFDMYAVMPPNTDAEVGQDFEEFFRAFQFE